MSNPTTNQPEQTPPQQSIIYDTCILSYIGNKYIIDKLLEYIQDLTTRGFASAISEVTAYELLNGSSIKKEEEGLSLLRSFMTYQVTDNILISSAQLSTLYREEKIPQENSISFPDKIIASTCILTGSLILTADTNDFPRPFFIEAEDKHIVYTKNDKEQLLDIKLLQPDYEIVKKRFMDRPKG